MDLSCLSGYLWISEIHLHIQILHAAQHSDTVKPPRGSFGCPYRSDRKTSSFGLFERPICHVEDANDEQKAVNLG